MNRFGVEPCEVVADGGVGAVCGVGMGNDDVVVDNTVAASASASELCTVDRGRRVPAEGIDYAGIILFDLPIGFDYFDGVAINPCGVDFIDLVEEHWETECAVAAIDIGVGHFYVCRVVP